jgi:UDP-perosamine 4-acetyltransferase
MNLPLIVLGAGGHAKVLVDALLGAGRPVHGLTDADPAKAGSALLGVPVLGGDKEVLAFAPEAVRLVNGIGSVRVSVLRRQLYDGFKSSGYFFERVVHASAIVAPDVVLAEGAQIMAGAVLQSGCHIGENAIINTRVAVDHDCVIGSHAHISPGVTLCGNVAIGEGSHIGAGATVIQGVRIGRNCMVAAGAVVIRDIPDGVTVAGLPAKEMHS